MFLGFKGGQNSIIIITLYNSSSTATSSTSAILARCSLDGFLIMSDSIMMSLSCAMPAFLASVWPEIFFALRNSTIFLPVVFSRLLNFPLPGYVCANAIIPGASGNAIYLNCRIPSVNRKTVSPSRCFNAEMHFFQYGLLSSPTPALPCFSPFRGRAPRV